MYPLGPLRAINWGHPLLLGQNDVPPATASLIFDIDIIQCVHIHMRTNQALQADQVFP